MSDSGYLRDKGGNKSSARLVFVFGMFANILYCGGMLFFLKINPLSVAAYFTSVTTVLGGLKLYQNSQEGRK